jgi:hypothetical protein
LEALPERAHQKVVAPPARCGLQGGVFKKGTTQECRRRPIKISWVFTRSTQEDQEKPLRRIQEGDGGKKGTVSKDVAAAARKDPGKAFLLAKSLGLPLRARHTA